MIPKIRAFIRLFLFGFLIIIYLIPVFIIFLFSGKNLKVALKIRRKYVNFVSNLIGMKVNLKGKPIGETCIYISNHRSYMDPAIVLRDALVLPVAKAEIEKWPLIGFGAKATGILYVKRENKKSRKNTVKSMGEYLDKGFSIIIYPEGTTHLEEQTIEFRHGAFLLAASKNIPIVPIAIDYEDDNDAWVNNDTFIPHFLRTFRKPRIYVNMTYGDPIRANDGMELLDKSKKWIDKQIAIMRNEKR